jgi:hypothetical protein
MADNNNVYTSSDGKQLIRIHTPAATLVSLGNNNDVYATVDVAGEEKQVLTVYALGGADLLATRSCYIPIEWPNDGAVPPVGAENFEYLNKSEYIRKFSGTADNDVTFKWAIPHDMDATLPFQYRVIGIVSEATGPSAEGVVFGAKGYSTSDLDSVSNSFGTEVTVTKSFTAAQNTTFITDWSGDVTIANISNDSVGQIEFRRIATDAGDTYAQQIAVTDIEIRYAAR